MGSLDRSSGRVLKNNKCLLCSVLDASEVIPAAAARGLVSLEEIDEIQNCEAPIDRFLEILLRRREVGTSRSPIRNQAGKSLQGGTEKRSSTEPDANVFSVFLEVLESKEEHRAWAKYLKDERDLIEAQLALEDSDEMEDVSEDDTLLKVGQGSREFRRLARLSQNVDMKVRNLRTDVVRKESQITQQPLSNSAKLLKEFSSTSRTSERDAKVLLNLYKGHCDVRSVRDSAIKSLLHIAAERMGFRVVKMMVEEFNFDPNDQDLYGNTPLHIACLCQKAQTVMYLLSLSYCDPNIQNEDRLTPLHVCARMGFDMVTKHLFNSRRVDKNLRDYEGKTAVEIMDENNSKLVRGTNMEHFAPPSEDQRDLGAELGLVRGTEILVKHKKLHAMLVSKNPKWQVGASESSFMPAETDTNKYDITSFPSSDVVLRDKNGYNKKSTERRSAIKKRARTREERLHEIIVKVDLWRSLCFFLVSIFVGVALCVALAFLLIWRSRN